MGQRAPTDQGLKPNQLYHAINPRLFPFKTTTEVPILEGVIEQDRALKALEIGLRLKKRNFNIYVAGASGTGKSSILKSILKKVAAKDPTPPDWCMVNNFRHPDEPIVFSLPPGRGVLLKRMMEELVSNLKTEIPRAFHSKDHQERIQRILNEGLESENRQFLELAKKGQEIGFLVKSTKEGIITIPLVRGKQIGTKEYSELPEDDRRQIEANRQRLEPIISQFLEATRDVEHKVHKSIQMAQRDLGREVVGKLMKNIREAFKDVQDVCRYLDSVEADIIDNIGKFLPDESDLQKAERQMRRPMREYQVNVLVDNSELRGAPVIFENTPTYYNLVGKIEKRVENGIYSTDFTMVKAGAMLKANGGYLVLHARDVLTYPFAWDALETMLRYQKVQIEEMGEQFQFLPTSGLRPDPIPVQCKVILIGSNYLYHLLMNQDEDFGKIFQVKAEFDSEVKMTKNALMEYAKFIATTCERDDLLPVDVHGVCAIVEYGARKAGHKEKMTLRFNNICNVLIEADAVARSKGDKVITRSHIQEAIKVRKERISLIAEKSCEEIIDGTVKIDTEGSKVGVVNGIAVYSFADLLFGRPIRISARVYQGKAGVINVEREARLSGRIFNKAVLIIAGFLGDRFAQERPLSINVSLAVEQSYGGIDGDSASVAEVCAILSSLSDLPVRQDLAVTGSISQCGEVQAIGAVNEKIEGFFEVCKAKGLTKTQGVIIPKANVQHLMLEKEVINAVRRGHFHIYAIDTVEEAIHLLTGIPAGEKDEKGKYPEGTVYARIMEKIARFEEKKGG